MPRKVSDTKLKVKSIKKKKTISKSRSGINVWMLIISIIIVSALVGAAVYFGQQNIIKDKDKEIEKINSRTTSLIKNLESMEKYISENIESQKVSKKNTIEYSNEYFSLELPESWKDYKSEDRVLKFGVNGQANSIDFYSNETSLLFNIAMIEKDKWEVVKDLSYYDSVKILEDEKFIFAYSIPKDVNEEMLNLKKAEVSEILGSFKLKNNLTSSEEENKVGEDDMAIENNEDLMVEEINNENINLDNNLE